MLFRSYPTGTIVETVESPFFQPVKGIVVNQTEPWEEGFAEAGEQWLLYPDFLHDGNRTGIGVIKLDDYASIAFGADFLLPFRQFLRRCEGGMEKHEMWLAALSDLVREDKRCFALILRDQMPGKTAGVYEKCEAYVERLSKRQEEILFY